MEQKIEDLEAKLKKFERNKSEKNVLLNRMEEISNSRVKQIQNIEKSIKTIKKKNTNCRFGMSCRRLFCRFDHKFLFRKDNRCQEARQIQCDDCEQSFQAKDPLREHVKYVHEISPVISTRSNVAASYVRNLAKKDNSESGDNCTETDTSFEYLEECLEISSDESSEPESENESQEDSENGEVSD